MNNYGKYKDLFSKIYDESQIQLDAKMSEHIYFKVGGPVDILLTPNDVQQLKETVTICKENNINFKWYVLGKGPLKEEIEADIKKNNLENDFILLGVTPNPYAYIRDCDIYVQPSRHEG